jgi:hypothetical protein
MYLHPERNPLRFLGRYCIISMEKQQLREIGTILHHAGRSGSGVKDSMVQRSGGKSKGSSHIPAGAPSRGFTGAAENRVDGAGFRTLEHQTRRNVETALRSGSADAGSRSAVRHGSFTFATWRVQLRAFCYWYQYRICWTIVL